MSLIRKSAVAATFLLALSSTGCFWKKKTPAPPAPPATPPPQTKSTATVKPAPPPPKIDTAPPAKDPPAVSVKLPDAPKPPQTKNANRRPRRTNPTAAKVQQPAPSTTPVPTPDPGPETPAAPKLGDLLTETQRADLLKKCDQSIQQARSALDQLASKQLSPDAAESASRARVFILQAEQARTRDPQTALQLAQRAEVLSRDLLRSNR